jgi:hypothetical protein
MLAPLVLAAVLLVGTNGQTMTRQNCNSAGHEAVIQADADAFIAGFFAFHETNDNGVGCGEIRTGGILKFLLIVNIVFHFIYRVYSILKVQ